MSDEKVYSRETCGECGFDGREWSLLRVATDSPRLADDWRSAFAGRSDEELRRRPNPEVWSAVEYAVHAAEIVRGWNAEVATLVSGGLVSISREPYPDADRFPYNEVPIDTALTSLESELERLADLASSLSEAERRTPLRVDNVRWQQGAVATGIGNALACLIHAIHDSAHHLDDIQRGLARIG